VLVVDDHAVFAEAVQARLAREPGLGPVWVACSAEAARDRVAAHRPSVVLLDMALGTASGLDVAEHVRRFAPDSRVVMLSGSQSVDSVVGALTRGARAYLPKTIDADRLAEVIRGVNRGEAWLEPYLLGRVLNDLLARTVAPPPDPLADLTPREHEVLQCLVDGLTRAEVARQLGVSANTVRTHTQNLLVKLGVHSTLELVSLALRHGVRASDS